MIPIAGGLGLGTLNTSPSHREKVEIGQQLLDQVLRDKSQLFISEDIIQIKSAFQNELQFSQDIESVDISRSVSSRFQILHVSFAIPISIIIASSFGYFWLSLALVSFGIVTLKTYFFFYKRYSRKLLCDTFQVITSQLTNEKKLYQKLLHLIDDIVIFRENENTDNRFKRLKVAFRDIALESFLHLRKCTQLAITRFPLKEEIDGNLICLLPDDSFESFTSNEELTSKALHTLKQLIRLQISELLKRFLFLFIGTYYLDSVDFNVDYCTYLQAAGFKDIQSESQKRQKALLSELCYYKSFYDQEHNQQAVPFDPNRPIIWPICRNIRKSLYASLTIVDVFESTLRHNEELTPEEKAIIESNLESLNVEIASIQDSAQSILKTIRKQDKQTHPQMLMESSDPKNGGDATEKNALAVKEYVAQDEVFEAYIPQRKEDCDDNFGDFTETENLDGGTEMPNNVFNELKHALKGKAIEHKVREAKALGIEVDIQKLEEEYVATVIEKVDNEERKRMFIKPTRAEAGADTNEGNTLGNYDFNMDIAMEATEKMRLLFGLKEETFECESPPESEVDSDS